MRQLLAAALLLTAPCLGFAADVQSLRGSRPNIVLVITDDQGYGPLGRHDNPWIRTPHMDALHDHSVRFDRFMVSPTCAPTRSALMTGRHPMRNGITHTINERERLTLAATTLPQSLRTAGYRSAIFGKWHLGDEDEYQPGARGFDESFIHGAGGIGQSYPCSCADAPDNSYFDPVIRHNGKFVQTKGFCTDVFFDAAIDWIDVQRQTGDPFFAYVATNAPHAPYFAPEPNRKRFADLGFDKNHAGFYGMVENIDENLGRLLASLESMKLFENTIVIFMSDNGMAGMAGPPLNQPIGTAADGKPMIANNGGMKGLKGSVDEGGVRVPLFVRWDGKLEHNQTVDHVVAHIDILPTLVELAGATLPTNQVEGRSLLPLLADPSGPWVDRLLFDHKGRWPTGAEPNDYQWVDFTVRGSQYRLVGEDELFDMDADPGQTKNCIDQHRDLAATMRQAYDQWWKTTRPLMINETAAMSKTKPYHEAFEAQQAAGGIPPWQRLR